MKRRKACSSPRRCLGSGGPAPLSRFWTSVLPYAIHLLTSPGVGLVILQCSEVAPTKAGLS